MNRRNCLLLLLVICLLCILCFNAYADAEDDIIIMPVDQIVGEERETDLVSESETEVNIGEEGDISNYEISRGQSNPSSSFMIEDGVLVQYTGLDHNIEIPKGVIEIGYGAFEGDQNLISVTIPDSVTRIDSDAFYGCSSLENIIIPNSVIEIGSYAFSYCDSLISIILPNNLKEIKEGLFSGCYKLEEITIPGSVSKIGTYAFYSCTALKNVEILNGTKSIEEAFLYCDELESITIPASVTTIDRTAFNGSPYVVIRGIAGSYAEQYAQAIGVPFNAPRLYIDTEDNEIILHISESRKLKTIQKPSVLSTKLSWMSTNEKVATVDSDGTIKAISTGTTNIIVQTIDRKGMEAQISVLVPEKSNIYLSCEKSEEIALGQMVWIQAGVYTPFSYSTGVSFPITWTTSDDSIASIDSFSIIDSNYYQAYIKGVGLGKARIIASTKDGGVASFEVEVIRPKPTGIKIDQKGPINLQKGDTLSLSATVIPEEAIPELEWGSLDTEIATVNSKGQVKAVGEGSTKIWVEDSTNRYCDYIEVKVSPRTPTMVKLNKSDTITLKLGKTLQLKAIVKPSDAVTRFTWKSSKQKIATVSKTGKVTPKKIGTTVITVKTSNGKKASVKVKVEAPPPKSIKITNGKIVTLTLGKKLKLETKMSPSYAQTKLTWSTSDKKIATVNAKGIVTPQKTGAVTITVKTGNGKKAKININVVAA